MNSVANGKITRETPFENVYIPAGAADNGTSFGAAFHVWNRVLGKPRTFVQDHAYWGCRSDDDECLKAINKVGMPCDTLDFEVLADRTVEKMLKVKLLGGFKERWSLAHVP